MLPITPTNPNHLPPFSNPSPLLNSDERLTTIKLKITGHILMIIHSRLKTQKHLMQYKKKTTYLSYSYADLLVLIPPSEVLASCFINPNLSNPLGEGTGPGS
jgi:hypothetical protein